MVARHEAMWISRGRLERFRALEVQVGDFRGLERQLGASQDRLERITVQARERIAGLERQNAALITQNAALTDRIVTLANRPPHVIQPPDTAKIVKETVEGMATVLNGWKDQPKPDVTTIPQLSMEQQGLDDRAGIPQSLQSFIPPWEEGFPPPNRAEFVNARVGEYTPYVPGEGNTTQPKGGME